MSSIHSNFILDLGRIIYKMLSRLQKVLIVVALFAGAMNTLCFTLQNKQTIVQHGDKKNFFHPYIQAGMRYVSNSVVIFLVIALKRKFTSNPDKRPPILSYILVALLNVLFSVFYYTALNFITSSVYQMMRGGTLIFTYIFTRVILKVGLVKHKVIGCIIIIAGLTTVGLSNYLIGSKPADTQLVSLGYGLIIIGIVLNGLYFVYEEYLIREYGIDPLWLLSIESLIALVMCALFIPFLAFVPCPFQASACVTDNDGNQVVQSVTAYFSDLSHNNIVLLGVILLLISMVTFHSTGIEIIQKMSSMVRAVIDVSRTVIIWLVGVVISATAGSNNKAYQWESLDWKKAVAQACGFLLLVFGNLIYYQIVTFQCFGVSPVALQKLQSSMVKIQQPGSQAELQIQIDSKVEIQQAIDSKVELK